ncbi:MAG: hypothetical protein K0U93_19060 [Gammaproteobacteria bacterium]|nr:hypothetical protein [Gammaproteobacteria bacterium]
MNAQTDLSNRALGRLAAVGLGLSVVAMISWPWWGDDWRQPGGPLLQTFAAIGSIFLVGAFIAAHGKRRGRQGRSGFKHHVILATIGLVLVACHSTGSLSRPPALLLGALLGLLVIGVWARTSGARQMAATFGTKPSVLATRAPAQREQLRAIIDRKSRLLETWQPHADEGQFSLTPTHWVRSPRRAWQYQRLVREERSLLGTNTTVSTRQAYWRLAHQLLAWSFLVGLLVHVVLVTWFAGYVADGRSVYWWHLAAWDLP